MLDSAGTQLKEEQSPIIGVTRIKTAQLMPLECCPSGELLLYTNTGKSAISLCLIHYTAWGPQKMYTHCVPGWHGLVKISALHNTGTVQRVGLHAVITKRSYASPDGIRMWLISVNRLIAATAQLSRLQLLYSHEAHLLRSMQGRVLPDSCKISASVEGLLHAGVLLPLRNENPCSTSRSRMLYALLLIHAVSLAAKCTC